jgi:hypothetical protein
MTISAMNVFPNPSNGTFNIEYTLVNATDVTIELFDAAGRKVKAVQNAGMSPGKYRMMINNNSEGLVAGTYTVCLSTSGERKMVRLVVI